jgi:hypothetical protein
MFVSWPLVFWIFRPLRWLTVVSSFTAAVYVAFSEKPLEFRRDNYAMTFVLVHCFLISRLIGRVRTQSFAYLYSQGFSRDAIWGHLWLASLMSVMATWLPCAVLILTPLRGMIQNAFDNPWFPLMASTEGGWLWSNLLLYVMFLPVFQYEWIRSSSPFRGLVSGHFLAIAYGIFGVLLYDRFFGFQPDSAKYWLTGCFLLVSLILGLFGRWIHRRMEIFS